MTDLLRQWISVNVSDSQIHMVLFDGGIGCQNTIPRDTCLHGRRQVIGQDPCAFDGRHAAQDFGIRDNRVVSACVRILTGSQAHLPQRERPLRYALIVAGRSVARYQCTDWA
ncbi:hypothetical protein MicloDRAFT_00046080 [Microvirga lotononidis]|uniref:Uncharacterized protein n=1 Tax=Microvirga lotononidis TaxID=864069 RepID=I4YVN9_9HYPH|nr:hypothetical protein MicloDRAFT_00046080 [Microvirga lotononidis]